MYLQPYCKYSKRRVFKQKKMKLTFDLVSASPSRQQPWQPGPAHSCPIPRRHLPVPPSRTCPTRESPGSPPPYDPRSGPRLQYGRNNNSDNSLLRGTLCFFKWLGKQLLKLHLVCLLLKLKCSKLRGGRT